MEPPLRHQAACWEAWSPAPTGPRFLALLAPLTSAVKRPALRCGRAKKQFGWVAVFQHVKIICVSVGLLVVLAGLSGIQAALP